ncbi:hypothetical protein OPV22_032656 [Ensete ventricosum]|uniref:FAF domain-containing protein n=1 Tax=Ensete ventricosum TaxID=4639 RepID=A0AAV8P1G8_ENSVE|nr:hypothetical protein OPV22_032656 [Ensete ventricosum]
MDPWAELREISEQPQLDRPTLVWSFSWEGITPADLIFPPIEMFGEIHFAEIPEPSSIPPLPNSLPSTSSAAMAARWSTIVKHEDAKEDDGLSPENSEHICTEGLGFESLQDAGDPTKGSMGNGSTLRRKENKETVVGQSSMAAMGQRLYMRSHSDIGLTSGEAVFPPPISTIGKGVKPWVYLKSFKKDGRLVIKKIKLPTQQCLQATRENGRLLLQLAHPTKQDEEEEEEEGSRNGTRDEPFCISL